MSDPVSNNNIFDPEQKVILLPWHEPEWLDRVTIWIDEQLAANGRHRTGSIELIHQRPWSAFARIPTDQGIVYFKAPAPTSASEVQLTEALRRWRPDCIVPVLAIDLEHHWMLTADGGLTLRELSRTPEQLAYWQQILPLYAGLQREMTDRVPEILAMGVSDRRLEVLPQKFERLLEDTENLRIDLESGLTAEEYKRLLKLRPTFAAQCLELANFGIPETLTHEEVTEVNVILGDGGYCFTDWDNGIAHPFFSLLVTLRSIEYWVKPTPSEKEMNQLRNLYLESWTDLATRTELLKAFNIAYKVGMVNRSLSYHRTFAPLPQRYKIEYDGIPGWLQDYLEVMT